MANTKITALSEDTAPTTDDLAILVNDPGGTPGNKKSTLANILKLALTNTVVQVFTSSNTYTPTAGMKKALVIAVGGGGSGQSCLLGNATLTVVSGGGGAGGAAIKLVAAAAIGSAQTVTIGVGAANASGSNSSLGVIVLATGGALGVVNPAANVVGTSANGGVGGTGSNAELNIAGGAGERGIIYSQINSMGGRGGTSIFGGGGAAVPVATAGNAGGLYGGGGSGASANSTTVRAGGTGANGVIYIVEFVG
jgi:hypothetical protein